MNTTQEETRVKCRSVHFMGVEVYARYDDQDYKDLFYVMWDFGKEMFKKFGEDRDGMHQWLRENGPLSFYPSVHWLWDGVFWDNGDGYWEKIGEREDKTELLRRQKGYVV